MPATERNIKFEINNISNINIHGMQLQDLVTNRNNARNIFKALNISMKFLDSKVSSWRNRKEYIDAQTTVNNLEVVNDNAERGIALMQSYNTKLSTDESQKQLILQVIEFHRKNFANSNKATIARSLKK